MDIIRAGRQGRFAMPEYRLFEQETLATKAQEPGRVYPLSWFFLLARGTQTESANLRDVTGEVVPLAFKFQGGEKMVQKKWFVLCLAGVLLCCLAGMVKAADERLPVNFQLA
jgi:hypothetical protein